MSAVGWPATVLTPSYGVLHAIAGSRELEQTTARFRGEAHPVRVFEVPGTSANVRYVVFDHRYLTPTRPGVVYHGDMPTRPYATDSSKFALFCAAAATWIASQPEPPAVIHLHDWHTATLAVLREYDPELERLKASRLYFTIHNLSYQGQRPLDHDESSLAAWFHGLAFDAARVADPAHADVYNPMAAALRLADRISAVSPTYAEEIQRPTDPATGFIGGEGLETLLAARASEGDLVGILNGIDYDTPPPPAQRWSNLIELCRDAATGFADGDARTVALESLAALPRRRPLHVLTSVGRVVDQKMRLFFEATDSSRAAIEDVLDLIGDAGVLLLLGSGEARYERRLVDLARSHRNFVYLCGYSEAVADALYSSGDLFLMPSSFEPCGLSQMLAMRCGQPCVVHGVGGLYDTVEDGVTGFVFEGNDPRQQAQDFASCVASALDLREDDPLHWEKIRSRARAARFDWQHAARHYVKEFYDYASD